MKLTLWCNVVLAEPALRALREGTRDHILLMARQGSTSVLNAPGRDAEIATADIAFGQPSVADCLEHRKLKWVAASSGGYTRFDTPEFKEAFRERGAIFTNMSSVYAEPCAQHALAMILAVSRQLLPAHRDQITDHAWNYTDRRNNVTLLKGSTVLLLGFGAIGRRLADLLAPFGVRIHAVRRQVRSERGVTIIPEEQLTAVLPTADHVVNVLPENDSTRNYVNARRLSAFKPGARFYNVGRGTTVDQQALLEALQSGRLGCAYLDVTDPEPLPRDHPLWSAPNCYITPHVAGGRRDEGEAIVAHFLANLAAFQRGAPMVDRVV